jgi:hypothetical protein
MLLTIEKLCCRFIFEKSVIFILPPLSLDHFLDFTLAAENIRTGQPVRFQPHMNILSPCACMVIHIISAK